MKARLSRYTCDSPVGKIRKIGGGGDLIMPSDSVLEVIEVETLEDLKTEIEALTPNQYFTYSLPKKGTQHRITTFSRLQESLGLDGQPREKVLEAVDWENGPIARSGLFLEFSKGPGVFVVDYDPQEGQPVKTREEVAALLEEAVPGITANGYIWGPSSSSYLRDTSTNEMVSDLKGQRFYFLVEDLHKVPAFGSYLYDRLVDLGHWWVKQAKGASGHLYVRTYVDEAVWRTMQPDFAARPHCIEPLEAVQGHVRVIEGQGTEMLVLGDLMPPSKERKVLRDKIKTKRETAKDSYRASGEYSKAINRSIESILDKEKELNPEIPEYELDELRARLDEASKVTQLKGDYPVILEDGQTVTVREILANKAKWDQKRCFDPRHLDDSEAKGIIYSDSASPKIYSYRGITYPLYNDLIPVDETHLNQFEVTRIIVDHLEAENKVYKHGEDIFMFGPSGSVKLDDYVLAEYLGNTFNFFKRKPRGGISKPVPSKTQLWQAISNLGTHPNILKVVYATERPIIGLDGRVSDERGIRGTSGAIRVYPSRDGEGYWSPVLPSKYDIEQVRKAVETLWAPLKEFKYVDGRSKFVALGALMLAVLKPHIGISPYIMITSDQPGAGKTYLANMIASISEGGGRTTTLREDETYISNELTTTLRAKYGVHIFDNYDGELQSKYLESFCTSELISPRTFHTHDETKVRNSLLVLINGNKTRVEGALSRRTYRIDILKDNRHDRDWEDPLGDIKEAKTGVREDILQAIYTIYHSYYLASPPKIYEEETTTFVRFDRLIRNVILWLKGEGISVLADFEDPHSQLEENRDMDPEAEEKYALIQRFKDLYGENPFNASEFAEAIQREMSHAPMSSRDNTLVALVKDISEGGVRSKHSATKIISNWLREVSEKPYLGVYITKLPKRNSRESYRYRVVDSESR